MFEGDVRVLLSVAHFSFKLQNEAFEVENRNADNVLARDSGLNPGTRSWEVERENVNIEHGIGDGAFGLVARGTATNLPGINGRMTVTIKRLEGILLGTKLV